MREEREAREEKEMQQKIIEQRKQEALIEE